ncbi:MAG: cob(I)yrinic acid a,c-diamide adenosyltransferase [Candidatus Limnocylindrus sp. ZSMar2m-chloro-G89]|nr:MAG: cob(I)yrinic acid a,c-diamide adenosyltransferase [Candidatus Limnocylindrus sp. ZSMar2m-chloro-G89]
MGSKRRGPRLVSSDGANEELKLPPSKVATGKGDEGTTGLLFGGNRISKDDVRTEAYGTVDEATAALGMARAELIGLGGAGIAALDETILSIQRDLFVVGAELATNPDAWSRLEDGRTKVSPKMLARINALLATTEAAIVFPKDFVIPGSSKASSAIELARTIIRRAERWCVTLGREGLLPGEHLLAYLNRLADLLWLLARQAETLEASATRSVSQTPVRE